MEGAGPRQVMAGARWGGVPVRYWGRAGQCRLRRRQGQLRGCEVVAVGGAVAGAIIRTVGVVAADSVRPR